MSDNWPTFLWTLPEEEFCSRCQTLKRFCFAWMKADALWSWYRWSLQQTRDWASNWRNYDLRIFKRWNWSKSWQKQSEMDLRSTTWVRGFAQLPMLHDFWHPDLHPDRGIWRAAEKVREMWWNKRNKLGGLARLCCNAVWKSLHPKLGQPAFLHQKQSSLKRNNITFVYI